MAGLEVGESTAFSLAIGILFCCCSLFL